MRPSDKTTGVKFKLTPKGCHWIVVVGGIPGLTTGTGNLPPARKFAFSPEIAVRVGSANVLMMPACSIARNVACTDPKVPVMLEGVSGPPLTEKGLVLFKLMTDVPKLAVPLRSIPS